ncbi:TPA: hypothetical protein UN285_000584 [Stenotrophomonas maltophilia]|nr:hypothetical protein [Stenotrophomonas maltophilia]HEL3014797.1 hypothetical protein [Stenotrophomonas maltophilia]HEL4809463.1 hypothetical protein [Stenotrophomonas maltophilia]HEL5391625.1 hypothetical protein [Stenotrophomonas maltophilia]
MALQPIDITTPQPNGKLGDPARVMSEKINANDQYLEQLAQSANSKAVAAKTTADAALPRVGGTVTGAIIMPGKPVQDMFRVYNVGSEAGIGGSFAGWADQKNPALQVDAQLNTQAYMPVRVTHWGVKHLWGLDVYEGGSFVGAQTSVHFHFAAGASRHQFIDNGNVIIAGTLTQNSDYRIKVDIASIDPSSAASSLRATRPVEYTDARDAAGPRRSGYVAHEHQAHFGLLVDGVKDGVREELVLVGDATPYAPGEEPVGYVPPRQELKEVPVLQSVNYVGMVPYLHAGWIEHDHRIAALENERNEMLATIAGLSARLKALEPST